MAPATGDRLIRELEKTCNLVKAYFERLTGDTTIETAVRLAVPGIEHGTVVYRTVARSQGLNPLRRQYSEDLRADEGVVAFFRRRGNHGVLAYHDTAAAIEAGFLQETENHRRFPDEINSMMAAPINGWSGSSVKLIGLLFVTSRERSRFQVKHTDSALFVADTIAIALIGIFAMLSPGKTSTPG